LRCWKSYAALLLLLLLLLLLHVIESKPHKLKARKLKSLKAPRTTAVAEFSP
jgi:hypothetical protein